MTFSVLRFFATIFPLGSAFTVGMDRRVRYLIGSCLKNRTSDGSPAWLWAPLLNDVFNHESASYSSEPLPECGE